MATATRPRADTLTFSLPRNDLLAALNNLVTIHRVSTLPILQCLLLRADDRRLLLTYTDLDRIVETRLTAAFEGDCAVAIPLRRLHDVVRTLPGDVTVSLSLTAKRATVSAGRSKFEIACMPAEEFPIAEIPKRKGALSVRAADLVAGIARVSTNIGTPETAGAITALKGLYLELPESGPRYIVGCTQHRFARVPLDVRQLDGGIAGGFVVPREAVSAITKLFAGVETVELYGSNQKLVIDSGDVRYTVDLMAELYPPYGHLITRFTPTSQAEVETEVFADAVRRVATLADGHAIELMFEKNDVTLRVTTAEVGNGEDVVPCTVQEPFTVRFNPRYLLDALDAIGAERTRIEYANANAPAKVTDPTAPDGALAMLSPVRPLGGTTR